MINESKHELNTILKNYFKNGDVLPPISDDNIGTCIAEFILFKENMIKKDADENEIVFDLTENAEYTVPINNFYNGVFAFNKNVGYVCDEERVIIEIDDSVTYLPIEKEINFIHQVRNAFAHDIKIDENCFQVTVNDHPFEIPFNLIKTFNKECLAIFKKKQTKADYPISITDVFFNDNELLTDYGKNLYKYLYTYMMLVCATNDMNSLPFAKMPSIYSEPCYVRRAPQSIEQSGLEIQNENEKRSHQYIHEKEMAESLLKETSDFNSELDNLYSHFNEQYYNGLQAKDSNFHHKVSDKITAVLREKFRSIRNAIEHANVFIEFDRIALLDMNNQNSNDSINFMIEIRTKQLFNIIDSIDTGIIYDDEFAYLTNVFTFSDKKFFSKLIVLQSVFNFIFENPYYSKLESIENTINDGDDKYTVRGIINILDKFYNHTNENNYLLLKKLIDYSKRLPREYATMKNEFENEYPTLDDDMEDSDFLAFSSCVQNLGLATSMLNETLDLQEYASVIIENHFNVSEDYIKARHKSKQKIR